MTDPRTFEERVRHACEEMVAALSEEERRELVTLQELSDEDRGLRVHYVAEFDVWEVRWCGRPLGAISREWLAAAP